MEEYISRITRLDQNTIVNDENVNAVVQQLQHNVDLLFNQWKSSHVTWNVSELLFGNIMDFDATGQKRFVNGGNMDSIEKVLTFNAYAGTLRYQENSKLNRTNWMTWDIPQFQQDNLRISRNIAIPQALRHQNLLIAFKFAPLQGNTVIEGERFDVYVNGVHSGAFSSGKTTINGTDEAKTGYAVYNLTGTESNILVEFVRSPTNDPTPSNYSVRFSNVFCGLHTLGNSPYTMNYPGNDSSFIGSNSDIEAFYDFKNNSVRPIPSFLLNNEHLEGDSSLTVNVTSTAASTQTKYFVGLNGSGNKTGINSENRMSFNAFNNIDYFDSNRVEVDFEFSESYGDLVLKSGTYYLDLRGNTKFDSIKVRDNCFVQMTTKGDSDQLVFGDITVLHNSRLEFINGSGDSKVRVKCNDINIEDYSIFEVECGTFGMPINTSGAVSVVDHSNFNISLNNTSIVNADGVNGFGFSVLPMDIRKFSNVNFANSNTNGLVCMITRSTSASTAVKLQRHCHLKIGNNFSGVVTVADDKRIYSDLHCDAEINSPLQVDGGQTSFETIETRKYSTFGAPSGYQTLVTITEESLLYSI